MQSRRPTRPTTKPSKQRSAKPAGSFWKNFDEAMAKPMSRHEGYMLHFEAINKIDKIMEALIRAGIEVEL